MPFLIYRTRASNKVLFETGPLVPPQVAVRAFSPKKTIPLTVYVKAELQLKLLLGCWNLGFLTNCFSWCGVAFRVSDMNPGDQGSNLQSAIKFTR